MKKKHVLAIVLVLALMIAAIVVSIPGAKAEGHANHCVCGGNCDAATVANGHTCETAEGWKVLETKYLSPKTVGTTVYMQIADGNYYLDDTFNLFTAYKEVTGNSTATISQPIRIQPGQNVTICLNGHRLQNNNRMFTVNGVLNICDCQGGGELYCTNSGSGIGKIMYTYSGGVANLFGGKVWAANPSSTKPNQGLICVGNGDQGDAAVAKLPGGLNIYGGEIKGTSVGALGGAIAVFHDCCTLNMYGGKVTGGTAPNGGNISMGSGSFNMTGGTIEGGEATSNGGNIYCGAAATVSTFNITGGTIKDGKAKLNGGNIHFDNKLNDTDNTAYIGGDAVITGGEVGATATTDTSGGNICVGGTGAVKLEVSGNAAITDGTATCTVSSKGNGGNIAVKTNGTLIIKDGTITGGYANNNGGNIALWGWMTMEGGVIKDGDCVSGPKFRNIYAQGGDMSISGGTIDGGIRLHPYSSSNEIYLSGNPNLLAEDGMCTFDFAPGNTGGTTKYRSHVYFGKTCAPGGTPTDAALSEDVRISCYIETSTAAGSIWTADQRWAHNLTDANLNQVAAVYYDGTKKTCFPANSHLVKDETVETDGYMTTGYGVQFGCICGGECEGVNGHVCQIVEWQPYSESLRVSIPISNYGKKISQDGNYYLTADTSLSSSLAVDVGQNISLDLMGRTLSGSVRPFKVNGTLNICTSRPGGLVNSTNTGIGAVLYTYSGGVCNLYGGKLQRTSSTACANGIICVGNGDAGAESPNTKTPGGLNIYGGEIVGTTLTSTGSGGAIAVFHDNCTLNMYGGIVRGGTANNGAAINTSGASKTNIYGGTIYGGTATNGGGAIAINASSQVKIYGGTITGGTAVNGGNIYANAGNLYIYSGAQITDGTATGLGGNIYHPANTMFIYGGTITGGKMGADPIDNDLYSKAGSEIKLQTDADMPYIRLEGGTKARLNLSGLTSTETKIVDFVNWPADPAYTGDVRVMNAPAGVEEYLVINENLPQNYVDDGWGLNGEYILDRPDIEACACGAKWENDAWVGGLATHTHTKEVFHPFYQEKLPFIVGNRYEAGKADTNGKNSQLILIKRADNKYNFYLYDDVEFTGMLNRYTTDDTTTVKDQLECSGKVLFFSTNRTNFSLNLNGNELKMNGAGIWVYSTTTINLSDTVGTGKFSAGNRVIYTLSGAAVSEAEVNIYGGTLQTVNSVTEVPIRCETCPNVEFNQYGGTILGTSMEGDTKISGGCVRVAAGTYNMYNGAIRDGHITVDTGGNATSGGNVFVNGGTFNMHGGEIANGSALLCNGGNVSINTGTFNMDGGKLTGGTVSKNSDGKNGIGGNVYCRDTFTAIGGEINGGNAATAGALYFGGPSKGVLGGDLKITTGNTAGFAGGVYIEGTSDIVMRDNATITGVETGTTGNGTGCLCAMGAGKLTMAGGKMDFGTQTKAHRGGVIQLNGGDFEMKAGEIIGGKVTKDDPSSTTTGFGGVMYISNANSDFKMSGGKISGGEAEVDGGNIYLNAGTINISGGIIDGGEATANGGNICMNAGTMDITGGTIEGGKATGKGGNIAVPAINLTVNISGGAVIKDGTATGAGGNIYMKDRTTLNISGEGTLITGGESTGNAGGNINLDSTLNKDNLNGAELNLTDGAKVTNGKAMSNGGNIYVNFSTVVTIDDAEVSGGTAQMGGNIYMGQYRNSSGTNHYHLFPTVTIKDSLIAGGTAVKDKNGGSALGGNIFLNGEGKLYVTGGEIKDGEAQRMGGNIYAYKADCNLGDECPLGEKIGVPTVEITGTTVSGGVAPTVGGSLYLPYTTATLTAVTQTGGTIQVETGSNAVFDSCNIAGEVTTAGGDLELISGTFANVVDKGGNLKLTGMVEITGTLTFKKGSSKFGTIINNGYDGEPITLVVNESELGDSVKLCTGCTDAEAMFNCTLVDYEFKVEGTDLYLKKIIRLVIYGADGEPLPYSTITEALASGEEFIGLGQDVTEDLTSDHTFTLDLGGYTLTGNINMEVGATLQGMDSTTNTYAVSAGKLDGTVIGEMAKSIQTADKKRYVAVMSEEDGSISFNRVYVGIQKIAYNTANEGVGYKTAIVMNDTAIAALTEVGDTGYIGINLWIEGGRPVAVPVSIADMTAGVPVEKNIVLTGQLKAWSEGTVGDGDLVYATAYMNGELDDTEYTVTSIEYKYGIGDIMRKIDSQFDGTSAENQARLKATYKKFSNVLADYMPTVRDAVKE